MATNSTRRPGYPLNSWIARAVNRIFSDWQLNTALRKSWIMNFSIRWFSPQMVANGKGWARLKLGARSLFQAPMWVTKVQVLGTLFVAFPSPSAGNRIRSRADRTQTGTNVRGWCCRQQPYRSATSPCFLLFVMSVVTIWWKEYNGAVLHILF